MILIEAPFPRACQAWLTILRVSDTNGKETSLRFYTNQHWHYFGIDLHARSMYGCILDQAGTVLVERNIESRL